MSLEPNFVRPDASVSKRETEKRNGLIRWFAAAVDEAVVGMIVSGSMGNGYGYSVKETSDIDMQLILTPETAGALRSIPYFGAAELAKALTGFMAGTFAQFSLTFEKDGVSMECHFWGREAFIAAITYETRETKRLRSGITTPSTDHGFSFTRGESVMDYYGEIIDGYPVGLFPSYREENGTMFLCRPITNILGMPRIVKADPELAAAIERTWNETIDRLAASGESEALDLSARNIINTLPGKNKTRPDVLEAIQEKTREALTARGVAFIN